MSAVLSAHITRRFDRWVALAADLIGRDLVRVERMLVPARPMERTLAAMLLDEALADPDTEDAARLAAPEWWQWKAEEIVAAALDVLADERRVA